VFLLAAASVTLALAAIASQSVDTYGTLLAPALPVSSLTRSIARFNQEGIVIPFPIRAIAQREALVVSAPRTAGTA
jgi:hypothetical protein